MEFTVDSNCPNFNLIPQEEIVGNKSIIQEQQLSSFPFFMKSKNFSGVAIT